MIIPSSPALVDGELYVPGLSADYISQKYGIALTDVAKLGSAENPHGASPLAQEAVKTVQNKLDIYPDWSARKLREAIAAKYGYSPDGVVCGSGETEVISMVIRAFAGVNEQVLMHKPCFPLYRIYANCEGRQPLYVPMGKDFEFEMDDYLDLLVKSCPKMAFLTSPHNPSGRFLEEHWVRKVCEAAGEQTLVVLDEAYIHYSETEGCMHLLREYPNLIILRTMSKAFGLAGLRVGFGISANTDLINPLRRIKPTWNMGQMQIAGGIAAINDDEHVARAVKTVVENRDYVTQELAKSDRFRMVPGSRSNFFLTQILDPDLNSTFVFNELLKRGVIVKDGNDIIGLGDRYLRVDVNLKKHMDRFLWALSDISNR